MASLGPAQRIGELDGLRGIAILSVFVHHALGVPLLWVGVDLFFVLSGFLITGVLTKRKGDGGSYFSYFYERRARRILAPYVLLLVISSLLFGVGWAKYWYWYALFGTNIGSALNQISHGSLQPLWSLAVEEQFYLVWPVVILVLSERALPWAAGAGVVVAPILRMLATPLFGTHFPIYFLTPFRMDLLCAGALLALIWRWRPSFFQNLRFTPYWVAAGTALLLLWLGRYPQFRTGSNTVVGNTLLYSIVMIFVASMVAIALGGSGIICWLLDQTALRYIGRISYSMYLIHATALIVVGQLIQNRALWFCVSLTATLAYATLTWHGFERRLVSSATSLQHDDLGRVVGLQALR